jgi:hypothetical protein
MIEIDDDSVQCLPEFRVGHARWQICFSKENWERAGYLFPHHLGLVPPVDLLTSEHRARSAYTQDLSKIVNE